MSRHKPHQQMKHKLACLLFKDVVCRLKSATVKVQSQLPPCIFAVVYSFVLNDKNDFYKSSALEAVFLIFFVCLDYDKKRQKA